MSSYLRKINFVFFGTPDFAAIILEKLIGEGLIPQAVVCNPDKPVGRKQIITPPPVKASIQNQVSSIKDKIKIFQPANVKDLLNTDYLLLNTKADLFIVVAYSQIITKEILEIPRLGVVGVHPSLLPKYRGPTPIQTAILNGEEKTGVTLYLMDEKVDHGGIVSSIKYQVSSADNYETLLKKLAGLGADLLIQFLRKYENVRNYEKIEVQPQDESQATYTKKFKTGDAYIEPADLENAQKEGGQIAIKIDRKIRALNPEPGIWTRSYENTKLYEITKTEKRVKLLVAELTPEKKLKLKKIQFEGKKSQIL